jgi:uncharacterized membrane protein YcaP (DUF421 family)
LGEESEISSFDLERMFIGDGEILFLLEIIVRTVIIFVFALMLVRLLGKRGQGELSPFEFVIIVALGSAVGDPMFYPEVPLVHSFVVIASVVALIRILEALTLKGGPTEELLESVPSCLVEDGRVVLGGLRRESLSRDELFMSLREHGVEQLGQVRRAYLEPSGRISCFSFAAGKATAGLPIIPTCDTLYHPPLSQETTVPQAGLWACAECGETYRLGSGQAFPACPRCDAGKWVPAGAAGVIGGGD